MGIARTTYNELENGRGITLSLARLVAEWTKRSVAAVVDEYEQRYEQRGRVAR